jgi:hypothetical protein
MHTLKVIRSVLTLLIISFAATSFYPGVMHAAASNVAINAQGLDAGIVWDDTDQPLRPRPTKTPTSTATNTPLPTATTPPTLTNTPSPAPTNTSLPSPVPAERNLYGLVGQGGLGEQIDAGLIQQQYSAGVRLRLLQLGWDVLQPSGPSNWDAGIAAAFQQRIDAFTLNYPDQQIVLDLGLQYPPSWVSAIDPLVDQYGNTWQARFPDGGVNVYWSPTVRQYVAAYIQRVFTSLNFRGRLAIVRVGPYRGELMYPEQINAGQNLSFWAFDGTAQLQNPVPGWRPGQPSPNGEAQRFYYWYVDNLANTFDFFRTEIRRYYQGYIAPVTPGVGMWSGNVSQLISHNLSDPSLQWYGTGNYWERLYQLLPGADAGVVNWCSSVGDGSGNDASPNWWEWSSARVQAHLAGRAGRQIYGENSGRNPYDTSGGADPRTTMQWIFSAVQNNGYMGLMWLSQSEMNDPRYASLEQFRYMVSIYP